VFYEFMFQAGHTDNVIPQHAKLRGTARAHKSPLGGSWSMSASPPKAAAAGAERSGS
jgi:metal-dependent amidase/aminoacylase/carboxypeptidase family protein